MREWLIQKRKDKGLSQQQVADAAFINRAYYSQIETGKRMPSQDICRRLADILDFQASVFFSEDTEQPFRFALQNIPMVLAHCNLNLEYTWIYNPHIDFQDQQIVGKRDDELDQNDGTIALMKLKQDVIDTQKPISRLIDFPLSTGNNTYQFIAEPIYKEGSLIGVVTAGMDLTDFRRRAFSESDGNSL